MKVRVANLMIYLSQDISALEGQTLREKLSYFLGKQVMLGHQEANEVGQRMIDSDGG